MLTPAPGQPDPKCKPGDDGDAGPQGSRGELGRAGAADTPGKNGRAGYQVRRGVGGGSGPRELQGETGAQGLAGNVPPQGPQGPQNAAGGPGVDGRQGQRGAMGTEGDQPGPSAQGPQGAGGPHGLCGPPGPTGLPGPPGRSLAAAPQENAAPPGEVVTADDRAGSTSASGGSNDLLGSRKSNVSEADEALGGDDEEVCRPWFADYAQRIAARLGPMVDPAVPRGRGVCAADEDTSQGAAARENDGGEESVPYAYFDVVEDDTKMPGRPTLFIVLSREEILMPLSGTVQLPAHLRQALHNGHTDGVDQMLLVHGGQAENGGQSSIALSYVVGNGAPLVWLSHAPTHGGSGMNGVFSFSQISRASRRYTCMLEARHLPGLAAALTARADDTRRQ